MGRTSGAMVNRFQRLSADVAARRKSRLNARSSNITCDSSAPPQRHFSASELRCSQTSARCHAPADVRTRQMRPEAHKLHRMRHQGVLFGPAAPASGPESQRHGTRTAGASASSARPRQNEAARAAAALAHSGAAPVWRCSAKAAAVRRRAAAGAAPAHSLGEGSAGGGGEARAAVFAGPKDAAASPRRLREGSLATDAAAKCRRSRLAFAAIVGADAAAVRGLGRTAVNSPF